MYAPSTQVQVLNSLRFREEILVETISFVPIFLRSTFYFGVSFAVLSLTPLICKILRDLPTRHFNPFISRWVNHHRDKTKWEHQRLHQPCYQP